MRKHLEVAPPLDQVLEGVVLPDGFSALIARCMAKDPARRPQDASELRELMIKVASGQGLGQRSTTETRTVTRIATQESSAPDHERRPTVDGEQLATSAELSQPATEEVDRPTPTNHTRTFLIAAVALIGIGAIGFFALSGSEPEPAPAAATAQAVDSAAPQTPPPERGGYGAREAGGSLRTRIARRGSGPEEGGSGSDLDQL